MNDSAAVKRAGETGLRGESARPRTHRVPPSGRSEIGLGIITLLVFGSLLAAVTYYAYHVFPFYYYFYELQNEMESKLKVAGFEKDKTIRDHLLRRIKKMEIPAREEDLRVMRDDNYMKIDLKYREVFYITFRGKDYDLQVFDFHAHAEGYYEKPKPLQIQGQ